MFVFKWTYSIFLFSFKLLLNISMYTEEPQNEHLEDENVQSSTTPEVKA